MLQNVLRKNELTLAASLILGASLNKPDEIEFTEQERLTAALKLLRHDPSYEVEPVCPPVPLDNEEIDSLLNSGDEKLFLTRISEVFCNFKSLASSFYPIEEYSTKITQKDCSSKIDFVRLKKVYEALMKINESEEGVYYKIMSESIENITDQLEKLKKNSQKQSYLSKSFVRIMVFWLAHEVLYDPTY